MVTARRFMAKHLPASFATLLFGILLSLAMGKLMYFLTARAIQSDAEARFRSMAGVAQYTIAARIQSYTDILRSTAGLFRVAPDATEQQFQQFVEQLDLARNYPGIQVVNYAEMATQTQRSALEKHLRERLKRLGVPKADEFRIPQREGDSTYTVIKYIQPLPPAWRSRIGVDLEARPYGRVPMAKSRDSNTLAATGTRIHVLSGPNQHGLAMRLPVYRGGMPIDTVQQRRAAYIGSVGIGFGVNALITGVVESLPIKDTRLVVTDLTPTSDESGIRASSVLYDSDNIPGRKKSARDDGAGTLHVALPIEFNQRIWRATFSIPTSAMYSNFDAYYPWLAALAGSITTGLLYALFQIMAASRRNAVKLAEEMTQELRASKTELQCSNEKLRRLAAHTEQIKEGERKRIAREIHDELGQNLLALRIDAEMLRERTRDTHGRLHARAEATLRQIDATIRAVRQIINDLRPNVLDLGLNAAVDWLARDFEQRTGIACYVVEDETEPCVEDHCATAFFRVLQESLSNVARHARATEVHIALHARDDTLLMTITDNGIGLQPGCRTRHGSFGLVGIEERISILGGSLSITSSPGTGTTLLIEVPVAPHGDVERSARSTTPQADSVAA